MVAYVGRGGLLLKEVDPVSSESCESYFRGMVLILIARRDHGICDNPSVIFGKVGAFPRGIWGNKSAMCILAGDPVRRKIELDQSLYITHKDARSGMRDFSYIARRLGNLLDLGVEGDAQTEIQHLEPQVRDLYKSARRGNSDPFSKEYRSNADLRKQNPPMGAYTNLSGGQRGVG